MNKIELNSHSVLGYLRVSADKQDVEKQELEIRRYCEKNNLKINEDNWIPVEASSKKSQSERKVDELVSRLNKEDILVVTETSRLGRSVGEVLMLIDDLVEKGVTIIVTKKDEVINKENRKKLTANLTFYSLFAELEREMISQRTREALASKKAKGERIGKPKGTIQSSIYDDKFWDIKELLSKQVPINVISRIIGIGKPLSLRQFLQKKELLSINRYGKRKNKA